MRIRAKSVGTAQVKVVNTDIATLGTTYAEGEIRVKDRLLSREDRSLPATFYPRAPQGDVTALVISLAGGDRDGLQAGDALAIYKTGELVKDQVAKKRIRLPDERIGLLMVFYTYQKMSFGLVLEADRQLDIDDLARNP